MRTEKFVLFCSFSFCLFFFFSSFWFTFTVGNSTNPVLYQVFYARTIEQSAIVNILDHVSPFTPFQFFYTASSTISRFIPIVLVQPTRATNFSTRRNNTKGKRKKPLKIIIENNIRCGKSFSCDFPFVKSSFPKKVDSFFFHEVCFFFSFSASFLLFAFFVLTFSFPLGSSGVLLDQKNGFINGEVEWSSFINYFFFLQVLSFIIVIAARAMKRFSGFFRLFFLLSSSSTH